MKAILLHEFGGVDNLTYADVPEPVLQNDDVLVDVKGNQHQPCRRKNACGQRARRPAQRPVAHCAGVGYFRNRHRWG